MGVKRFLKGIGPLFFSLLLLSSCIPDGMKKELDKNMQFGQRMMTDQYFQRAIGLIEMHKLRHGHYPLTLKRLEYLSFSDSSIFQFVEYKRLDTVYELNAVNVFPNMDGNVNPKVDLKYPAGFWEGLGCVRSNTMD